MPKQPASALVFDVRTPHKCQGGPSAGAGAGFADGDAGWEVLFVILLAGGAGLGGVPMAAPVVVGSFGFVVETVSFRLYPMTSANTTMTAKMAAAQPNIVLALLCDPRSGRCGAAGSFEPER
jgi:hypothetical protein